MAATKSQTLGGEIAFRKLEDDRGVNLTIEKVLNEHLIKLKSILLKNNAIKLNHDQNMISHHVDKRSQEAIEEELSRLIIKLVQYKGPSLTHRATAYSQLASQLHQELEGQIFTDEKGTLTTLRAEQKQTKVELSRTHAHLQQEIVIKDQTIASLAADKNELENANIALSRSYEAVQRELDRALRNQSQTHQHAVEVRMQGLDFKAEVDRRCARIIASIQSRMGFVPSGIEKQVAYLKLLKAPGDPAYDHVRGMALEHSVKQKIMSKVKIDDNEDEGRDSSAWYKKVIKSEGSGIFKRSQDSLHQYQKQQKNVNRLSGSPLKINYDQNDDTDGDEELDDNEEENVDSNDLEKKKKTQEDWVQWATGISVDNHDQYDSNNELENFISNSRLGIAEGQSITFRKDAFAEFLAKARRLAHKDEVQIPKVPTYARNINIVNEKQYLSVNKRNNSESIDTP